MNARLDALLQMEIEREELASNNGSHNVEGQTAVSLEQTQLVESEHVVPGKVVNLISQTQNLVHLKVKINGTVVDAILDTGASRSLVSSEIVDKLGIPAQHCGVLLGAIGQSQMRIDKEVNVNIKVDRVIDCSFDLLVFSPLINSKLSMLLGADFLRENKIEVDFSNRLIIKHLDTGGRIDLYYDVDGCIIKKLCCSIPCYAAHSIELEQNNISTVPVKYDCNLINECEMYMYNDDDVQKGIAHKVRGLSGLADAGSRNVYMLANEGKVMVKEGDQIGVLNTVLQIDAKEPSESVISDDRLMEGVDLSHLEPSEQTRVSNIIGQYRPAFSTEDADIGLAGVTGHHIRLTDETPIYQRPRRFPPPISEEINI